MVTVQQVAGEMFADEGEHEYDATRRLSDKILSAFNHAYGAGRREIAQRLRQVLADHEAAFGDGAEKRGSYDPLGQADLWVRFIEARDRYKQVCDSRRSDRAAADEALEAMKEAYRRWSCA